MTCVTNQARKIIKRIQAKKAAYQTGLLDGGTPCHPFSPKTDWSQEERDAYTKGFDEASDKLSEANP